MTDSKGFPLKVQIGLSEKSGASKGNQKKFRGDLSNITKFPDPHIITI